MQIKEYLLDTFGYNDSTNKKLIEKINLLSSKEESVKLFSHLINSQCKWMARIVHDSNAPEMSWWDPVYKIENLENNWSKSLELWLDFIYSKTEQDLLSEVQFVGFDGGQWAATPLDIS